MSDISFVKGGIGGCFSTYRGMYWCDSAGDGGVAGKGGIITSSLDSRINAFNGDMVTNDNYDNVIDQQTDKLLANSLQLVNYKDEKSIIPCYIFAQGGVLRAVYKNNAWWDVKNGLNSSNFKFLFEEDVGSNIDSVSESKSLEETKIICVRQELKDKRSNGNSIKTLYHNSVLNNSQGIGSRSWIYRT